MLSSRSPYRNSEGITAVTETETLNVRQLLRETPGFAAPEIARLEEAIAGSQSSEVRQEIDALCAELNGPEPPSSMLARAGIGSYLIGKHQRAHSLLAQVSNDPYALYYHALVLTALDKHAAAAERFKEAAEAGFDAVECALREAGAIRAAGDTDRAETMLRATSSAGATRAEYSYQMGCVLADRGDTFGAVEYFERAVDMDSHHSRALFSLASENALYGNDDEAIRLYEQSLSKPPLYLGALLNLGLLYEDAENYQAAAYCFRRVLDADPTNQRALLYLKDIEAASHMFYDEESARNEARMRQLLDRPVTDFELTVRSRNCLESLEINSLGDLTRISEQDLLAGKNFGETSLTEVRDLLAQFGLHIGQHLHADSSHDVIFEQEPLSPQEQTLLQGSISELDLSVRSRKCMTRLGITTIGDLVRRTADELLASKNFGVTSLNEIRGKLTEFELKLRND